MDITASSFTLRKNAKRAAEAMIRKGTAPAVDYCVKPSDDGRFEIVWKTVKTAPKTDEVETEIAEASADQPAAASPTEAASQTEPAATEPAPALSEPVPNEWPQGTRAMVRKGKSSWREATIISRLDPDHWRAEYPGGGSGLFREADIRAYDPKRDATPAKQPRRAKATAQQKSSRSRYAIDPEAIAAGRLPQRAPVVTSAANPHYQKHFDRLFGLAKAETGMGCATTRSKAATAIQKWSHATARICWPCTPLRRPPHERARRTGGLPRSVCRAAPQSRDTPALALPRDARSTITSDYRPNQIRLLCRRKIYFSAPAVDLPYRQGDLKCRGRVGEVSCAFL